MNKKAVHDIILIMAILLVAGGIYMYMRMSEKTGTTATVVVRVDGAVYGEYPLDGDKVIELDSGHGSNKIVISAGSVWMEDADCPDKICVKTGRIKNPGQTIVCLPHKVVVEIAGESAGIDAVS